MKGKVILVGAGPGDSGLLTLKGKKAIESADVVVYDRLVSPEIKDMIPKTAEHIDVGKNVAYHPIPQNEINLILVNKALEGNRVVRLKGGDPFLFGRGGEEIEALIEKDIEFEVVPGVTSALSVPAYGGIPVTHRDFCSSLHIITGHAKAGNELNINFEALVKTKGTLVFLMGVNSLPIICKGLIDAGMPADTSAAIIQDGTLPTQRRISTNVSMLPNKAKEEKIKSPAISIIGKVCSLADRFDWFDKLPLKGKKIVVTRPKERAGTLSEKLRSLGASVLEYACIETKPIEPCPKLDNAIKNIKTYSWIVFTSPAGVKVVMEHIFNDGFDCRIFGEMKIAAIGQATAAEIRKYGLITDLIPNIYSAKELGKALAKIATGKLLITRTEFGSEDLTKELKDLDYVDIAVYKTFYRNKDAASYIEKISNADFVTFTSASTVRGFVGSLDDNFDLSSVNGICIGEQTAEEAKKYGIRTTVSSNAIIDDMVQIILEEVSK